MMYRMALVLISVILIAGCKGGGGGGASADSVSHFASVGSGVSTGSGGSDSAIYGLISSDTASSPLGSSTEPITLAHSPEPGTLALLGLGLLGLYRLKKKKKLVTKTQSHHVTR